MRFRICLSLALLLVFCGHSWAATPFYVGDWHDNTVGRNPDQVAIASDKLRIESRKGQHASIVYNLADAGPFENGEIFRVSDVNAVPDPLGCGPKNKISYLIIKPLPPADLEHGESFQSIRLFFYGGDNAPTPQTLESDLALCEIHPYGRTAAQ